MTDKLQSNVVSKLSTDEENTNTSWSLLSVMLMAIQARIISDCLPGGETRGLIVIPLHNYHGDLDLTTFIDY